MTDANELSIGGFALSVILYVLLALVYKCIGDSLGDRFKPLIAVLCGIGLGLAALAYTGIPWTAKNLIDYLLQGFMTGSSAVGLYEIQRTAVRPRS